MKVLVTRPVDDAAGFSDLLELHGMTVALAPVMEIVPVDEALPPMTGVSHLVFTSANGVRAFVAVSNGREWPAFVVGPSTATEARRHGFRIAGVDKSTVESLARLISKEVASPACLLHVAGSHRAGNLGALLAASDVKVKRVVLYEARPVAALQETVRQQFQNGEIDAVTLFSPRSARLFMDLIERAGLEKYTDLVVFACLSQAVADALPTGLSKCVAERPEQSAMIDILKSART